MLYSYGTCKSYIIYTLSISVIVEPLETEEYENRTSINRALKRRWSTDSLENQSQKAVAAAQQKIRRYSAYDSAEGVDIFSCCFPHPPPPKNIVDVLYLYAFFVSSNYNWFSLKKSVIVESFQKNCGVKVSLVYQFNIFQVNGWRESSACVSVLNTIEIQHLCVYCTFCTKNVVLSIL